VSDSDKGDSEKNQRADDSASTTAPDQQPPSRNTQSVADAQQDHKIEALEDGLKRGERWIIGLTAALTIAAFAALYIAHGQWGVMREQTGVMQQQLADSRKASDAQDKVTVKTLSNLKDQADALKKQADALHDLVGATTKAANAAKTSADNSGKSADATQRLAEATSKAARSSQDLAAAANEANIVSRELVATSQQAINTNQATQRAFIVAKGVDDLEEITYLPALLGNTPLGYIAAVQWENTGSTPTRDLTISSNCWLDWYRKAPKDDPRAFDVSSIDSADQFLQKNPDRPRPAGPHQLFHAGGCAIGIVLIPAMQDLLFAGTSYYVFGTARYKDVFNSEYVHRTDFCFAMQLTGSFLANDPRYAKLKLKPLGITAQPCTKHNCADEECDKEPFQPVTSPEPAKAPANPPA
jgi:hypothetical protein